jgi:methyl-accepting chemotaxis protein
MRIARVVMVVLGFLGLFSLVLAGERLWRAQSKVVQDEQLAALAQARSDWYAGIVALSFERSVTQVALALDTPIPPAFMDLIEQQRAESDRLLEQALDRIVNKPSFRNQAMFEAEVRALRATIASLRAEAEGLVSRPATSRDAVRSHDLPYDLKATIEELFTASSLLVLPDGDSSTNEMMLSRIQTLSWEAREYGGRARTFYAIATLTGEPVPMAFTGEAYVDTVRAQSAWQALGMAARAVDLPPELTAEIEAAAQLFEGSYLPALDRIDVAMADMRAGVATDMPYDFETFFTLSNAALDAVAGIAPVAGEHIQTYWADQLSASKRARVFSILVMLMTGGLTLLSLFALQRQMIRPLESATATLQDMAAGNLDRAFRQTHRGLDEIWVIWDAMEALTVTLREARAVAEREKEAEQRAREGIIGTLMQALERLSCGDLTHEITDDYGEIYAELVANFNMTCANLRLVVAEVVEAALDIAKRSDALGMAVEDLSARTDRQTSLVTETAERLKELSVLLEEAARNSAASTQTASDAARTAEAGGEVVDSTTNSMQLIRNTSREISGISGMIDDIAFQTSLLSLNAGVEAARAGEAGRGFAIVAQEVRALADQVSDAARQVKELVATSEANVRSGVEDVERTGDALREITTMVKAVQGNITEIDDASRVQASTLSQIGRTVQEIDATARQNAAMADEARDTSNALRAKSEELRSAVGRFVISDAPDAPDVQHLLAPPAKRLAG